MGLDVGARAYPPRRSCLAPGRPSPRCCPGMAPSTADTAPAGPGGQATPPGAVQAPRAPALRGAPALPQLRAVLATPVGRRALLHAAVGPLPLLEEARAHPPRRCPRPGRALLPPLLRRAGSPARGPRAPAHPASLAPQPQPLAGGTAGGLGSHRRGRRGWPGSVATVAARGPRPGGRRRPGLLERAPPLSWRGRRPARRRGPLGPFEERPPGRASAGVRRVKPGSHRQSPRGRPQRARGGASRAPAQGANGATGAGPTRQPGRAAGAERRRVQPPPRARPETSVGHR